MSDPSSAAKVGEIFSTAGTAFSKLGELTLTLEPTKTIRTPKRKWTEEDIEKLKKTITNFTNDLAAVRHHFKKRTV